VGAFFQNFLELVLLALIVLVFGRVIVSWVDPQGRNSASTFIIQATEPILAPVRRLLPQTGMIDFSAMIVLLILFTIQRVIT
jgi:YggT family protein